MRSIRRKTWVVGGGIVGLACAIRLQEAGRDVVIVTRDGLFATTSAIAAAIWYPYLAEPENLVLRWSARTLEVLLEFAEDPDAAIRERDLLELFTHAVPDPPWAGKRNRLRRPRVHELPLGFVDAYELRVPVVESPRHLPWLQRRFIARGGSIERRELSARDLSGLCDAADLVVNCTGLGATELCNDGEMIPVRGQVLRVDNPGVSRCIVAEEGPHGIAYVIPRENDVILGGSADRGIRDCTPDPDCTERILRAAAALEPALAGVEVLDVRVGLRPYRSRVRLDRDEHGVIHCYGHGGSGYTLSWGCAEDVVRLAAR